MQQAYGEWRVAFNVQIHRQNRSAHEKRKKNKVRQNKIYLDLNCGILWFLKLATA
jgi:hypothetical protein